MADTVGQSKKKKVVALGKHELSKFGDFAHVLMPPSIPQWQTALLAVDTAQPAATREHVWKYWYPEARIVIGSPNSDRQLRYLQNWLRIRALWLSRINDDQSDVRSVIAFRTNEWRELLNATSERPSLNKHPLQSATRGSGQTKHNKNKKPAPTNKQITAVFVDFFDAHITDLPLPDFWRGRPLATFSGSVLPADNDSMYTVRFIMWELHELAFRNELVELDKYLAPIYRGDVDALYQRRSLTAGIFFIDLNVDDETVPNRGAGLACPDLTGRAPHLEALRRVLVHWPGIPKELVTTLPFTALCSPIMFEEMEGMLLRFYCQKFFEVCGRPPVLPRCVPAN